MEGVPVDLDRQHDGNPGQIQAVLAVVARGVLDGREFETEADDKPSDVGFKDAGRRGADEAPVDQMAPEGPDAGAPGTGQTIDLGLEAGDGDQSPGDGVVDGLGEVLGHAAPARSTSVRSGLVTTRLLRLAACATTRSVDR
jgi:hypothetical protein